MNLDQAKKYKHLHIALEKMTEDGWDITKMVCRTFGFLEGYSAGVNDSLVQVNLHSYRSDLKRTHDELEAKILKLIDEVKQ